MDDFYILFCKNSMEIESLYYYNKTSAGHLENIARNVYRDRVTLLFTGNVPRGVFCEQSSQKTRELRREIMLCMISVHREARYCERSEQYRERITYEGI